MWGEAPSSFSPGPRHHHHDKTPHYFTIRLIEMKWAYHKSTSFKRPSPGRQLLFYTRHWTPIFFLTPSLRAYVRLEHSFPLGHNHHPTASRWRRRHTLTTVRFCSLVNSRQFENWFFFLSPLEHFTTTEMNGDFQGLFHILSYIFVKHSRASLSLCLRTMVYRCSSTAFIVFNVSLSLCS